MKVTDTIDRLFEASPDEYLSSLGIVRKSPSPPRPPENAEKPDDETLLALKGDLLNDLPEEEPDYEAMDGDDLFNEWQKYYVRGPISKGETVHTLISALGYSDLDEFFTDNSGAVEAVLAWTIDWLDRNKTPGGWRDALIAEIRNAKSS